MKSENHSPFIRHILLVSVCGLVCIAISFFFLDTHLAHLFQQSEMQKIYFYSREITNIGLSTHYFIIALAGYTWARFLFNRFSFLRFSRTESQRQLVQTYSLFLFKCLAVIGITLQLLKLAIGRLRPHASPDFYNATFDPISLHWHWHSFPSGHSQVLFTVATFCALIWPRWRWTFLVTAFFLALTRVSTHQHFLSDIIAGGLFGYLGVHWLWHRWGPGQGPKNDINLR